MEFLEYLEEKLHIEPHPILVHFPIAFYFLEFVFLLYWIKKQDKNFLDFARFVFRLGYIFMVVAMIFGFHDAGGVAGIQGRVRNHFMAAASVFLFYTARAFFWRFGKVEEASYKQTQLLFAFAGNILVAITGYFGGLLVYAK